MYPYKTADYLAPLYPHAKGCRTAVPAGDRRKGEETTGYYGGWMRRRRGVASV